MKSTKAIRNVSNDFIKYTVAMSTGSKPSFPFGT